MRLTIAAVVFIVFQSCPQGQVSADGVVSRMERVAELMLNHPERCGQHGTTESEIIPVVNCGDKLCKLPNSICEYNFVADRFSCLELSDDCKQLIVEKTKKSKSRWVKKGANKDRRKSVIEDVLRARSGHEKEKDESSERSETVVTRGQSEPAVVKTKNGRLRYRVLRGKAKKIARRRLRSKTRGAKILHREPIHIKEERLALVETLEELRNDRISAQEEAVPHAEPVDVVQESSSESVSSRKPNGRAKALGARIETHSGIAIPLTSGDKKKENSIPRARSMHEIHIGNTEALRARVRSRAQHDPLKSAEQQSTTLESSTETTSAPPETTQASEEETTTLSFIHVPSRPIRKHRTRSTPAITRRLSLQTTTPTSEQAESTEGTIEANAGESDRLGGIIKRHRLKKKNGRELFGVRLLAIRPSEDARQISSVKQISESIDEGDEKETAQSVSGEKKPSPEPEPATSSSEKSHSKSSHEQPAAEPELNKVTAEKHVAGESKKLQSHESIPQLPDKIKEHSEQATSTESGLEALTSGDNDEKEHPSAEEPETDESEIEKELPSGEKIEDLTEDVSTEEGSGEGILAEKPSGIPEDGEDNLPGSDWHKSCCEWASEGQCTTNRAFMLPMCQKSCGSFKCMWDNLDECNIKVDLSHCLKRSPVLAESVDERKTTTVHRRRLRTRVLSGGRTVVLEERIPLTVRRPVPGHRGIRVALRKVVDD
uniref:ShKT domain-containing protein n=1 Tax=Plectus sambesii TaxID=2011161 RepID=A0A914VZC0_9BILA